LWDTQTLAAVAVLTGHTFPITSVHFSPSSSLIAAASRDACIRLWSTSSGAPVAVLTSRTSAAVCSVSWSSDEALVAVGACDGSVCVWESATGLQRSSLQCPQAQPVAVMALSPASGLIAVADGPPSALVHVFAMASSSLLASTALKGAAELLQWSADGQSLKDDQGDLWCKP
jgi:WD40 repeat protein